MSSLISRNIRIAGRRTSVRLEADMWEALEELCWWENLRIDDICDRVEAARRESGFTSSLRVYILSYFRNLAQTYERAGRGARAAMHRPGGAASQAPPVAPPPTGMDR